VDSDESQIGSSKLPGVHTKVLFGDPAKAELTASILELADHGLA